MALRAVALVVLPAGLAVLEAPEGLGRRLAAVAALAVRRVARLAVALAEQLVRQAPLGRRVVPRAGRPVVALERLRLPAVLAVGQRHGAEVAGALAALPDDLVLVAGELQGAPVPRLAQARPAAFAVGALEAEPVAVHRLRAEVERRAGAGVDEGRRAEELDHHAEERRVVGAALRAAAAAQRDERRHAGQRAPEHAQAPGVDGRLEGEQRDRARRAQQAEDARREEQDGRVPQVLVLRLPVAADPPAVALDLAAAAGDGHGPGAGAATSGNMSLGSPAC